MCTDKDTRPRTPDTVNPEDTINTVPRDSRAAIPLYGKMALRNFHSQQFRASFRDQGLVPIYFLGPHYYRLCDKSSTHYFELNTEEYDRIRSKRKLAQFCESMRRYTVRTETTDLRFRESIEEGLFTLPVHKIWSTAAICDFLRRVPGLDGLLSWYENSMSSPVVHGRQLGELGIRCILTPGMGSYGFEYEGFLAREAQRSGLKVVSAITNYDNIVNRGFRGFNPDGVAVWSQLMADETMRLQRIPASKIEITGAQQFDEFFSPLRISRDDYIRSVGLDPSKKTILFAGGVNVTRYFEIYRLFVERDHDPRLIPCNVIIRPYPHGKLLTSPAWKVLEHLFRESARVHISVPPINTAEDPVGASLQNDLLCHDEVVNDLHCQLRYSDVMINVYSTISLEAAICDLPTIHMGYDLYTFGHKYHITTAFQQRQTHNRRRLRLAASKVAESESDLVKYVNDYLEDRSADREARHEYALSECGYLDGMSSRRLASFVKAYTDSA